MKLQSMTDFVLESESRMDQNILSDLEIMGELRQITVYAKFLKQPLTLGMFIPCDEDGQPLENPYTKIYTDNELSGNVDAWEYREYEEAKKRVLFQNVKDIKVIKNISRDFHMTSIDSVSMWYSWNKSKNIEDLLKHDIDLTLTTNAIKQV